MIVMIIVMTIVILMVIVIVIVIVASQFTNLIPGRDPIALIDGTRLEIIQYMYSHTCMHIVE